MGSDVRPPSFGAASLVTFRRLRAVSVVSGSASRVGEGLLFNDAIAILRKPAGIELPLVSAPQEG